MSPLFTPYTIFFNTRPHLIKVWLWLKITSSCKSIVGFNFQRRGHKNSRQIQCLGFFYIFVEIIGIQIPTCHTYKHTRQINAYALAFVRTSLKVPFETATPSSFTSNDCLVFIYWRMWLFEETLNDSHFIEIHMNNLENWITTSFFWSFQFQNIKTDYLV